MELSSRPTTSTSPQGSRRASARPVNRNPSRRVTSRGGPSRVRAGGSWRTTPATCTPSWENSP